MGRAQELGVYAWKENQRVVGLANTLFGLFLQSSRFARRLERIAQDRRNGDYATYHSYGHAGAFLISFPFPVSVAALGQKERIERGADRHITAAPSKHTIFFLSLFRVPRVRRCQLYTKSCSSRVTFGPKYLYIITTPIHSHVDEDLE